MMRREEEERLTFLASPPGVSLETGAHAVSNTQTAVLTGRTADSWTRKKENKNQPWEIDRIEGITYCLKSKLSLCNPNLRITQ